MDVNENFERLEHYINRLTEDLETLRRENDELNGQLQSLKEKISVVSRENEQIKKDKEAVKGRIEQLISRLDDAFSSKNEHLEQAEVAHTETE